jgi:hypothetical protein
MFRLEVVDIEAVQGIKYVAEDVAKGFMKILCAFGYEKLKEDVGAVLWFKDDGHIARFHFIVTSIAARMKDVEVEVCLTEDFSL